MKKLTWNQLEKKFENLGNLVLGEEDNVELHTEEEVVIVAKDIRTKDGNSVGYKLV